MRIDITSNLGILRHSAPTLGLARLADKMSNKKKRTLKVEGQRSYVRSSEPPTAMEDLKSFCPETIDAFLNEAECLLDAAQGKKRLLCFVCCFMQAFEARKKLGQWETSLNYQKLAHERLIRLLKVADLQAAYAGKALIEEEESSAAGEKEGDAPGASSSKKDKAKEPEKVVGPSGSNLTMRPYVASARHYFHSTSLFATVTVLRTNGLGDRFEVTMV